MEVTYQLEPEDISRLIQYIRGHRSKLRPAFIYAFVIFVSIVYFLAAGFTIFTLRGNAAGTIFPVLLIGFVYVAYIIYKWLIKPYIAEQKARIDPQSLSQKTMIVAPAGIFVRHTFGEATLHWPLITDLIEDRDCFYFFLDKNNALIVPQRAFPSAEVAHNFFATAKHNWIAARNLASSNQVADTTTWPPPPSIRNS